MSTTSYDTAVTADVLANDSDADGDILIFNGIPSSPDGIVTINHPSGTLTFMPRSGFSGVATVNYQITDSR
jgi:hypothetical protein